MSLKNLLYNLLGLAKREAQSVLDAQKPAICAAVDTAVARIGQEVGNYTQGDVARRYIKAQVGQVLAKVKMSDGARSLVTVLVAGYIEGIDLAPARDYTIAAVTAAAERLKAQIQGARL